MANLERVNVGTDPTEDPAIIAANQARDDASVAAIDADAVKAAAGNDDVPVVEPTVPVRPEAIPEKFWNAETGTVNTEAMVKEEAYLKEQAAAKLAGDAKPEDSSNEGDDDESGNTPAEGQSKVVEAARAEFAEKGELSDDMYSSLETQGLTRDMVDTYISGQQSAVTALQDAAYGNFEGGQEDYAKATEWARENLTEDEIATLDVQITSKNPAIVAEGAKALKVKYEAGADITPETTITGGNGASTSGAYFKSTAEMSTAMSDARYKTDPAFRAEVADKIARAGEAGINLFG